MPLVEMRSSAEIFRYRGIKLVGVLNRPAGPQGRRYPAVLFLHGLPGAEKNVDIQRALLARGVASFALSFRGAWGSEGDYAIYDLPDQAAAALAFLAAQPFVDPRRLGVFGFSMGGWAALHTAARQKSVRAAAVVAPAGGPEMVAGGTRDLIKRLGRILHVPSKAALAEDFIRSVREQDPAFSAASFGRPLLFVHGTDDDIVPHQVSLRLFAAARGPKKLILADGAHHDFLDRRAWLSRRVVSWLVLALSGRRSKGRARRISRP